MPESAGPAPSRPLDPDAIDVWLFDLDNTLYPASCRLFDQVDVAMGRYIADMLSLEPQEARALQKRYFREHGTTLRGLMDNHDIDPHDYLAAVHDIDLTPVAPNPRLDAALARLPGRKLIFTNGSVPHAQGVMDRLGVARHFEAIFDIVASDFVPKPEMAPYRKLLAEHAIDPTRCFFAEDSARNLVPAHDLGMTTLYVRHQAEWNVDAHDDAAYIHHRCDDLTAWLESVVGTD
jgi:putative hydrolase of the HAD superfamily